MGAVRSLCSARARASSQVAGEVQLSLQLVEDELQVQRGEQARLQRCMASFEALEASGMRVEAMQRAQRARELVVHRLVLEQKRAALQVGPWIHMHVYMFM